MKEKVKIYGVLNMLLLIYSLSGIFSKLASSATFLSFKFLVFYGLVILCLGIYALVWQQVIKKLPLTNAFSNKAITIVWGIIWGYIFFQESITIGKIIGAIIIIIGVILFNRESNSEENE